MINCETHCWQVSPICLWLTSAIPLSPNHSHFHLSTFPALLGASFSLTWTAHRFPAHSSLQPQYFFFFFFLCPSPPSGCSGTNSAPGGEKRSAVALKEWRAEDIATVLGHSRACKHRQSHEQRALLKEKEGLQEQWGFLWKGWEQLQ